VVPARRAGLGSIGVHVAVLAAIYAWHTRSAGAVHTAAPPPSPTIDITIAPPIAAPPIATPPPPAPAVAPAPPVIAPTAPAPTRGPVLAPPTPVLAPPAGAAPRITAAPTAGAPPVVASIEAGGARPTETGVPPVPGSRAYRMRGAELRPPDETLAPIANAGKRREPAPAPSGKLVEHGSEWVAPDLVVPMRVKQDGTVAFKREKNFEAHWIIPIPSRKGIGDMLAEWYQDPYAQKNARRVQDMPKHEQAVDGGWDAGAGGDGLPSGKTREAGRPSEGGPTVAIAGGSFDITAWAMRKAHVGDPYASRKRSLINATYDERVQIGAAYRTRQLARTPELMHKNLELLARQQLPAAELRADLFALWDECAEGDGPTGEAGQRARALVIGWIRAHLPATGPDAFGAEELARLDRGRTSSQHFAPY
jgi:hypothetical protein